MISPWMRREEEEEDDDDDGGGGGGVEFEEVDDDDGGGGEVRSQLGELDCSLPPPIKAQLGGSQLETLANFDLPYDFVASSRHFSDLIEVPVDYALLWPLDSAAFKMLVTTQQLLPTIAKEKAGNSGVTVTLEPNFGGHQFNLTLLELQEFDDGEVFQWSKVTTPICNLILGKVYLNHHGTMHICGIRQYSCKLKFKGQSILDRNPQQVHGFVEDAMGKKVATLFGK
ncbi:unnamed protein product [Camellia sinensis]